MLLVEAKAHANELIHEGSGRRLEAKGGDDPTERQLSHVTIGAAIDGACASLVADTALPWKISRDSHYQLSNRFAWACKLTELGLPVILVYLGFLHADEMADRGAPFHHADEWSELVKSHGALVVPSSVWDTRWTVHGQAFIPLLKAIDQPLPIQSGA